MDSLWERTSDRPHFEPLNVDGLDVDVAVVGGGIAGLVTALLLKRAGRTVALLEAKRIAGGETNHTTAHVTALQDAGFATIASKFGKDGARRIAEAGMRSIELLEKLATELGIACDFERVPAYVFTERARDVPRLKDEHRALAAAGFSCELLADAPLPFRTEAAIRIDRQARYHPLKFLLPVAKLIDQDESHVFEDTRVVKLVEGEPCKVVTERGTVLAHHVVVTTDAITANRFFMQTKVAPYRTYVIAVRAENPPDGLFYDIEDPYHYIRLQRTEQGDLLIVGGEDHRVGEESDTGRHYDRLLEWTRQRFGEVELVYQWSGQVLEPLDGLPYIGRNSLSSRVYVASGFSGNGMVNGLLTGQILTDELTGGEHPCAKMLAATRIKPLASAKAFVSENLDFPKHLLLDRLPAGTRSLEAVPPGEGRIVAHHGRKLAVYRAEDGSIRALSPVCTHMGCHVRWNMEAKSWDCPCHGSRFDTAGRVLHGQAKSDLRAIDLEEEEREAPPAEA